MLLSAGQFYLKQPPWKKEQKLLQILQCGKELALHLVQVFFIAAFC